MPSRLTAISYALLIKELMAGPWTVHDLVESLGFQAHTLNTYLKALEAQKLIHIQSYQLDRMGRPKSAEWVWGAGRNARKHFTPEQIRLSKNRRNAQYRARQKQIKMQSIAVNVLTNPQLLL